MKIPALISNVSSPVDLGGRQESALEFFYNFPRWFWYSWFAEHFEEKLQKCLLIINQPLNIQFEFLLNECYRRRDC